MFCVKCGNSVNHNEYCPKCGNFCEEPKSTQQSNQTPQNLSSDEIAKGVKDGMFNKDMLDNGLGLISIESIIIAIGIGLHFKSIGVGIISFVVLLFLWFIPYIGSFMMVGMSILWGFLGYGLGESFGGLWAGVGLGALFGLISLVYHFSVKN